MSVAVEMNLKKKIFLAKSHSAKQGRSETQNSVNTKKVSAGFSLSKNENGPPMAK